MNRFTISEGFGRTSNTCEVRELFEDDVQFMVATVAPGEKDGTWYIPGRCDGPRAKENIRSFSLIVHDLDSGELTMEEIAQRCRERGQAAWIVPTFSWTLEKPKVRVIRLLDREITVSENVKLAQAEWKAIREADEEVLGLSGFCDPVCHDLGRLFYFPRKPEGVSFPTPLFVEGEWPSGGQTIGIVAEVPAALAGLGAAAEHLNGSSRTERTKRLARVYNLVRPCTRALNDAGYVYESTTAAGAYVFSPPHAPGRGGVTVITGDDGNTRVFSHHTTGELAQSVFPRGADSLDLLEVYGETHDPLFTAANEVLNSNDPVVAKALLEESKADSRFLPWVQKRAGRRVTGTDESGVEGAKWAQCLAPSIFEIERMDVPEQEYLLEGLWPKQEVGMVTAHGGTGKSWFALEAAMSIAAGVPFLGLSTLPGGGRVVYITADDSLNETLRRIQKILGKRAWTQDVVARLDRHFKLYVTQGRGMHLAEFHRETQSVTPTLAYADLLDELTGLYDLIVIDTLTRMHQGANENSNADMAAVVALFEKLSMRLQTTIVMVHHSAKGTRKEGQDYSMSRGASAVVDACRFELNLKTVLDPELREPFKRSYPKAECVGVSVTKINGGMRPEPFYTVLTGTGHTRMTGGFEEIQELRVASVSERIKAFLLENEDGVSMGRIQQEVPGKAAKIVEAVNLMRASGVVYIVQSGTKKTVFLTEAGRADK